VKTRYRKKRLLLVIWLLVGVFLFISCSAANYGKLESKREVTRWFKEYRVVSGYRYYYRGTRSQPVAVVGIKEKYVLDSKLWIAVDPESRDFRTLIDRVSLQDTGGRTQAWGFIIRDASGNEVGLWYSAIRAAAIQIDADGRITKLLPMRAVTTGNQP